MENAPDSTILITGASRGLGLEMTRQCAAAGWGVIATCREPASAQALSAIAREAGGRVEIFPLDVADSGAISLLARRLRGRQVDILLNNAGVYEPEGAGFGRTDEATWQRVHQINVLAPLKMAEAFLAHVEAGRRRVIAAVSSRMGSIEDNAMGGYYAYRSSKAAVNMVMKTLAIELKPRGITCVALSPGWVRTDMGGPGAPLSPEQSVRGLRRVLERITLAETGRFIEHDGTEVPW